MFHHRFRYLTSLGVLLAGSSVYASPPQIDLMVLYTPAAVSKIGGTQALNKLIDFSIINTHLIYKNSGIYQRLRLVHSGAVNFQENVIANTEDMVVALASKTDGHADAIHSLRDQYGADIVLLLVDGTPWPDWTGGDANVLYENTTNLSEYAPFALVDSGSLESGTAFPHELGHAMGLHHDWYQSANDSVPYPYARGYINRNAGWRTIMSYDNECNAAGKVCPRILFFSNPDLTYHGLPLGVAEGTKTNCQRKVLSSSPCDADARKTLNNTAPTVAAFRPTVVDNSLGRVQNLAPQGTLQTYTPSFSWQATPAATRYHMLIGVAPATGTAEGIPEGNTLVSDEWYDASQICSSTVCRVTPTAKFSAGQHFWSVHAQSANAVGTWSDAIDLTLVSATMTGAPNVVQIGAAESASSKHPTVYWHQALGGGGQPTATQYKVAVWNRDQDTEAYYSDWIDAAVLCDQSLCAHTVPIALPAGNYHWKVRANSAYGKGDYATRLYLNVTTAACAGTKTALAVTSSELLLNLANFCLDGANYSGDLTLRLNANQSWGLVGQPQLSVTGGTCLAGSGQLTASATDLSLRLPSFCLDGNQVPFGGTVRLKLNGQWDLKP